LLKQHNYLEREEYIRDELLARGLWGIVEGITVRPRKPTVPAAVTGVKGWKQDAAEDPESASAAGTGQMISETTPESTDSVYMSDFRRYLIQRENYIKDVGMATAEMRRSLDSSVRQPDNDKKYIHVADALWQDIPTDCKRVEKISARADLHKLSAIRRVDVARATAYQTRINEIATELPRSGTDHPKRCLHST
jgi:hypothetical protein